MKSSEFDILKGADIYSLVLFSLFKLVDSPEYSTIGELPYILDKKNLLNLCTYFGGRTIKIPTVAELYSVMNVLLLYQYVKVDGIDYDEAVAKIGYKQSELNNIKKFYNSICDILDNYNFNRGVSFKW